LIGHDQAIAAFSQGLASGRLHHAWLISGPEGIGKGLFARKAALRLLAEGMGGTGSGPDGEAPFDVPDDHPAASLIEAGSHPEYAVLERLARESTGELARSIVVDQVRALQRLFANTPALSPWRAVVIDAVDDLERSAANALLKNLEEPPSKCVFFLVSHAAERVLPTLRSRCRQLRLSPLDDDAMTSALQAALPGADDEEIAGLVRAGGGAPGRALAFRGLEIDALDAALDDLVRNGDPSNSKRSRLAQTLSGKAAQPRYEAFLARAPSVIAAQARQRRGPALAEALRLWERAHDLAGSATPLSLDPQSVVFELAGMLAALAKPQIRGQKADG
jgi:DNA polymerase-3 subunit delta'